MGDSSCQPVSAVDSTAINQGGFFHLDVMGEIIKNNRLKKKKKSFLHLLSVGE